MRLYKLVSNKDTDLTLTDYLNSVGFRQSYTLIQVVEYKTGYDWTILAQGR